MTTNKFLKLSLYAFVLSYSISSCANNPGGDVTEDNVPPSPTVIFISPEPQPELITESNYGVLFQSFDGNHFSEGYSDLPNITPLIIQLKGTPIWIAGTSNFGSSMWVVALDSGELQSFSILEGEIIEISIQDNELPPGMPPIMNFSEDKISLLNFSAANISQFSQPIPIGESDFAYINTLGDIVLNQNGQIRSLPANALKDGRILRDEFGRLLVYSDPSNEYAHGILGDEFEPTTITLIQTSPEFGILNTIQIPEGLVIEGRMPIWVDLDQDGQREIIITVSNSTQGAQILVYEEDGSLLAQSDPIGLGSRWRHQIAVAPFGPNGEIELVDVLTPHIGGVLEFFRLEGTKLVIVDQISGLTSHMIRSRNLDMAAAADYDNDGQIEILLPVQSRNKLALVSHTQNGPLIEWQYDLEGNLTTNINSVLDADTQIAVAVGTDENLLYVWLP